MEVDSDGDGTADETREPFIPLNTMKMIMSSMKLQTDDGDGNPEEAYSYEYVDGMMTSYSETYDWDSDGIADETRTSIYVDGDIVSEMAEYDYDSDGIVDEYYSYSEEYDADGNLISEREEYDFDGDGVADEYSYYNRRNMIQMVTIFEGYESEDGSWSYSYDSDGNTLSMSESEDIVDEYISEYEYNEDGSLSSVYDGWDDTYYDR